MPSGPVHKLEKSIQANLTPNENCLKQIAVSSVPSQKLEGYIQENLKPNRESLKQIDQAVDAIWDLLRSQIPVKEVAKGRLRVGARALHPRRVRCSQRWWC